MSCDRCGSIVESHWVFCRQCGFRLSPDAREAILTRHPAAMSKSKREGLGASASHVTNGSGTPGEITRKNGATNKSSGGDTEAREHWETFEADESWDTSMERGVRRSSRRRRGVTAAHVAGAIGVLVVLVLIGAGVLVHMDVRGRLDQTTSELADARSDLKSTAAKLDGTTSRLDSTAAKLATRTRERDGARAALDSLRQENSAIEGELDAAQGHLADQAGQLAQQEGQLEQQESQLALQQGQIATLKACLAGVATALEAAVNRNYAATAGALIGVQPSCEQAFALF